MTPRVTATWHVARDHMQQHRSHARVSTVYSWTQIKSLPQQRTRTHWQGDTKPLSRCGPWTPRHNSGWGGGTHRDPSPFPGVTCQAGTRTRQPQGNETHTDMPGITPTLPTQTRPETPNRTHRHARRQKHNLGWGPAPCGAGDSHLGREAETRRESDGERARAGAEGTLPPLRGHRLQPHTSPLLGFPGASPLAPLDSPALEASGFLFISVSGCLSRPLFSSVFSLSVSSGSLSLSQNTPDSAFVWFPLSLSLLLCVSVSLSISVSASHCFLKLL